MEKEIPFQDKLDNALYEYGEGVAFDTNYIPARLLFEFAIKLFENTPLAGDKGRQDDILDKIFSAITVQDQLDMGIIDEAFLVEEWEDNQPFEDLTSIREQYNK